jgi:hypothetical protein
VLRYIAIMRNISAVLASLALACLLLAPYATAKNVWGSRKKKEKQPKTQFEQLNENFQDTGLFDSQDSSDPLTRLLTVAMTEDMDGIGLALKLVEMLALHFKTEETRAHFFDLDLRGLFDHVADGFADGLADGGDFMKNDMVSDMLSQSGEDVYNYVVSSIDMSSSFLSQIKVVGKSKRKLNKIMIDIPEDFRPVIAMLVELDAGTVRSMLAGVVSSLKPMEQLMLNKLMAGDLNGWLNLWKQYLQNDGDIERIRQWLVPMANQLPDELRDIVDDKVTFKNFMMDMFKFNDADDATTGTSSSWRKQR